MAKYDITYSCGHTGVVELFGKEKDRQSKIQWYENNGLCPECYKKKMMEKKSQMPLTINAVLDLTVDKHLENAERGIRFIDPHYNERFLIPDGDTIRIQMEDNKYADYTCRYIDDYHVEVGSQLYHICQFAELMEQNGYKTIPLRTSLPNMAYVFVESHNCVGIVLKGESGYRPTAIYGNTPAETRAEVDKMNGNLKISKAQAQAMNCGSMFGWDTPAADPKNYDDKGNPIKPKRKNKEYER